MRLVAAVSKPVSKPELPPNGAYTTYLDLLEELTESPTTFDYDYDFDPGPTYSKNLKRLGRWQIEATVVQRPYIWARLLLMLHLDNRKQN